MTIASLTAAADKLVSVLTEENAALAACAPADGSSRAPLTPEMRQRMASLSRRVEAAAEANERRLTVLMFAQRRVIEAIAEAVASVNGGAGTYARTGAARPLPLGRGGACPALSLDRAL